jgi:hypothetical protein
MNKNLMRLFNLVAPRALITYSHKVRGNKL